MNRYATLTPEQLTIKAAQLLRDALPDRDDPAFFNAHMAIAKSKGMTWIEGLEFVIERRRMN